MAAPTPTDKLKTALDWIGINDQAHRDRFILEFVSTANDFKLMTDDDVDSGVKGFTSAKKDPFNVPFKVRALLKCVVYWAQDYIRCDEVPAYPSTQAEFLQAIEEARERSKIRAEATKSGKSLLEAYAFKKFQKANTWHDIREEFTDLLSKVYGSNQVPLAYVIRAEVTPNANAVYANWTERAIATAPLKGAYFESDTAIVHSLLLKIFGATDHYAWIRKHKLKRNGRLDWLSLEEHFEGDGYRDVRLQQAVKTLATLHFKSERIMSFELFCSKFEECVQAKQESQRPMFEEDKMEFMFERIQHPDLLNEIKIQKALYSLDKNSVTFSRLVDTMSKELATVAGRAIPTNRTVSAVGTGGDGRAGGAKCPDTGVYDADGSVFTGTYTRSQWNALSKEEWALVRNTRSNGGGANAKGQKRDKKQQRKLKQLVTKQKKKLASVREQIVEKKRKLAAMSTSRVGDSDTSDSSDEDTGKNAGRAFGGSSEMAKKKKKKAGGGK